MSVESETTRELAEVIGVLKVSADSVRERLMEITMAQQDAGWPERTRVNNAVAHLRRLEEVGLLSRRPDGRYVTEALAAERYLRELSLLPT